MRIAVVEFAGRGGMIHYAYQLCRGLSDAGADVHLLTSTHYELAGLPHPFVVRPELRLWDSKPAGAAAVSRVARLSRKARRVVRAARYYAEWVRLMGTLRRLRPDVVQFGDVRFPSDAGGFAMLRRAGLRLADVCHNVRPFRSAASSGDVVRRSALVRSAYRAVYRQFDQIFVHFDRNRREFLDTFDVDASRVSWIPHGNELLFDELRDATHSPEAVRRELGLDPSHEIVLLFGSLSRYKGADVLIRAFAQIAARRPRARLVLAGFPSADFDVGAHQQLARDLGVADAVRFAVRYIESGEVAAWFTAARVAVFPYRLIYQSGAVHVAQTFGVPIVASRVGAFADVIRDGESGLLVTPDDPPALAAAILRILEDDALAARLGRRAWTDARTAYDWRRIADRMIARYDAVLRAS